MEYCKTKQRIADVKGRVDKEHTDRQIIPDENMQQDKELQTEHKQTEYRQRTAEKSEGKTQVKLL
jgi:hypothetical protein